MARIEVLTQDSIDFSKKGLASKLPIRVFNIKDYSLTAEEIEKIKKILPDLIVDVSSIDLPILSKLPDKSIVIEQTPKPGVTDPDGEETRKVIQRTLGREIGNVSFSKQYLYIGDLNDEQYILLTKQLGNPLINEFRRVDSKRWNPIVGVGFHFPEVNLPKPKAFRYIDLGISDGQLKKISDERLLALNLEEMKTIKELFQDKDFIAKRKEIGLEDKPTDAELESLAQTWSEHCIHKKFNAKWIYTTEDPKDEANLPLVTGSVFKSIIKEATTRIQKEYGKDWIVSVFEDNSGVIKLNDKWNIAHKVETHNHPSGLDGFGGANTGTGGVIRDPGSTGKSMKPVSSQYGFRTPHPDSYKDLPLDIQSPARTLETVVAGVENYGNNFGLPTMCGQVMIEDGWLKPAVYVGCIAVAPAEINGRLTHTKEMKSGYIALSLGGKVGKDGIHGATGSSTDLSAKAEQSEQVNQSVQIGNPIIEKNVFEVMAILQKLDYIEASQDCGAGGWNSAIGELTELLNELEEKRCKIQNKFKEKNITAETSLDKRLEAISDVIDLKRMASPFIDTLKQKIISGEIFYRKSNGKGGAVMDLSNVLEKYQGLTGWEKLVSEAQEREIIVIKPEALEKVLEICKHNNVEATKIAEFNDSGFYHVIDQSQTIAFLPIEFLHRGLPQMTIKAHWQPSKNKEPNIPLQENITETLLKMLARPNMQIYDWIMTRFDHEVQGGSLIKPIVGKGRGKSDAVAYRPVLTEKQVAIETWGSNPWQGDIDSYHMGRNNVVDSVGRVIASGGNLEKITFNGNTTCPKPEKDFYIAAQVIRMLKGSADAEIAFGTPRISGKDSTSMERSYISTETGKEVHVKAKPELLINALAIIPDDSTLTTCDFKIDGDIVYIIGETKDELGASEYYAMHNEIGRNVPKSNLEEIKKRYEAISEAIKRGLVHSAQYIGKGGLATAIANSAIAGDLGVSISLDSLEESIESIGRADKIIYSETTGRFVVSVPELKKKEFEEKMQGIYTREIGKVKSSKEFDVFYKNKQVIKTNVDVLREKNKGEIRF